MATNKIAIRRDTAAGWASADPTLVAGEFALETDSHKLKNGDGTTAYTSLGYLRPINAVTVTGNHTVASNEDVVNVNAASATITLPAADVIGRRVTVRKISESAGTVTVSRASTDTITRATLTSVTLTSNGDFWTLEVVTSGRWDLVDGYETIDSVAIDGVKRHTGEMEQYGSVTVTRGTTVVSNEFGSTSGNMFALGGAAYITFSPAFVAAPTARINTTDGSADMANARTIAASDMLIQAYSATNTGSFLTSWHAIGRWYA